MRLVDEGLAEPPDFDALYRSDPDPWGVEASWYELRKTAVTLSALPNPHYARAWEPGCGPGLTSSALAPRVEELVATDSSIVAVDLARARCRDLKNVRVEHSAVPSTPDSPPFDLIVAAEFLYYVADLPAALDALYSVAGPGCHLVFLHWGHRPHDAFRSGPDLHAHVAIDALDREATRVVSHADRDFVLDVYEAAG